MPNKFILVLGAVVACGLATQWSGSFVCAQGHDSSESFAIQPGLASDDPVVRLRQSIDAGHWELAVETILSVIDDDSRDLVDTTPGGSAIRTLLSVRNRTISFANRQLALHPELRQEWRRRVDSRANSLFQIARQDASETSLRDIADTWFFSSVGDQATLDLGLGYAEQGQLARAINCLCRIDQRLDRLRVRVNGESVDDEFYPDSDLSIAEIAARIVLLRSMTDRVDSQADVAWFRTQFEGVAGQLGPQRGDLSDLLVQQLEALVTSPVAGSDREMASSLIPNADPWKIRMPDRSASRNDGSSTEPVPPSRPVVIGNQLLWRDGQRIYAARLETGQPAFDNGLEQGVSDLRGYVIWQSRTTIDDKSSGVAGSAAGSLTVANARVFGLFDDHGTQQVIGIDLESQCKMLPGFPVLPPGVSFEFASCPVVDGGRMFIAARQRNPGTAQFAIFVLCYELVNAEDATALRLVWQKQIYQGQVTQANSGRSQSEGHGTDDIPMGLTLDEGQLFCSLGQGAMGCLSAENGRLDWLVTYPRWHERHPDQELGRYLPMRSKQPPLVAGDTVFVLPPDHPGVFFIDRKTGLVHCSIPLPAATQLLDASAETLLVGGQQLVWLDRITGRIEMRIPDTFVNTLSGMRMPAGRFGGRPFVTDSWVWFANRDTVWKIGREPSGETGQPDRTPVKFSEIVSDRQQEFSRRGHLIMENSMMIIADTESINALPVDDEPKK